MKQPAKSYGGWLIQPDGNRKAVYPKNLQKFTLNEIRELLGCKGLTLVETSPTQQLWFASEGTLKQNPEKNLTASLITGERIYGKVFLCQKGLVIS